MSLTYTDENSINSLEDLAVVLVTGMITLTTLQNQQVRATELGILNEEMESRVKTIIWDLRRLMHLYRDQTEAVLELVPDDFNVDSIIASLKARELVKAKEMTKKSRVKNATKEQPANL